MPRLVELASVDQNLRRFTEIAMSQLNLRVSRFGDSGLLIY